MLDTTSLFLHVLAAVGIIAGGTVQVLAGTRMRSAATGRDLAVWARFTRTGGMVTLVSAAVSLLTGGHLAGAVWGGPRGGFANPFITLGLVGLLVLAPIGPMVGGARLRRLAQAADDLGTRALTPEVKADVRTAGLWGPVHSLVGVAIGLVALMVYKPGWATGAALLVVTFVIGWASAYALPTVHSSHEPAGHSSPSRP